MHGGEMMMQRRTYRNGQYQASGSYRSPGGEESIDVTLSLTNGVITDIAVTPNATLPNSIAFQNMFTEGIKEQVMGKHIDDLDITHVSGSSLTPKGFNEALEQIKTQANV